MYKLHKRGPQLFFDFMATKFTLVLLLKIILKIIYSKSCILYHIAYTTIEALLYQPLRFILTFKSNRSMISFGRKHYKYDMHNLLSFSCSLGSWVSLWNFETIRGSLMKPKWQKLASLAQKYAHSSFSFCFQRIPF